MSLYELHNYTAPVDYVISSYIREYDIAKANISILLYKGIISKEEYITYYNMDRMSRQISIGLLRKKNEDVSKAISEGTKEFRKLFFESNNIQDYEILSIKNDAIFLINKIPEITKFYNIEFINKNLYTSFYKLPPLELYYYGNMSSEKEYIHIKGIKPEQLQLHNEYFLEFLLTIFNTAQVGTIEEVINIIQLFYSKYINLELNIGYYREFNSNSTFVINYSPNYMFEKFGAEHLQEHRKNIVNIAYNAGIITQLYKIFSTMFFHKKNK